MKLQCFCFMQIRHYGCIVFALCNEAVWRWSCFALCKWSNMTLQRFFFMQMKSVHEVVVLQIKLHDIWRNFYMVMINVVYTGTATCFKPSHFTYLVYTGTITCSVTFCRMLSAVGGGGSKDTGQAIAKAGSGVPSTPNKSNTRIRY